MESAETTSPLKALASSTPIFVFPQAVGPATQTILGAMAASFPFYASAPSAAARVHWAESSASARSGTRSSPPANT